MNITNECLAYKLFGDLLDSVVDQTERNCFQMIDTNSLKSNDVQEAKYYLQNITQQNILKIKKCHKTHCQQC